MYIITFTLCELYIYINIIICLRVYIYYIGETKTWIIQKISIKNVVINIEKGQTDDILTSDDVMNNPFDTTKSEEKMMGLAWLLRIKMVSI